MDILNKILELLNAQNKKQIELTNFLGISKNAFTNWKSGNNTSYIKHLPEIAEFFGVSTDYLLGRESSEDFTYALYDEITHDLTKDEIEQIKNFANFLRSNKEGDILR